jgi:hypothetical protein
MQEWVVIIYSKQEFGNEGLNQGSNDNGIRIANTAISKYIHKYT